MIPGHGWSATFKARYTKPDGTTGHTLHRMGVVYFDADGNGWVAPDGAQQLRPASHIRGFDGYDRTPIPVSICPAAGWNIRYEAPESSSQVTAWVLYDDGTVRGVEVHGDGPEVVGDAWQSFGAANAVGYEPEGGWPADGR